MFKKNERLANSRGSSVIQNVRLQSFDSSHTNYENIIENINLAGNFKSHRISTYLDAQKQGKLHK